MRISGRILTFCTALVPLLLCVSPAAPASASPETPAATAPADGVRAANGGEPDTLVAENGNLALYADMTAGGSAGSFRVLNRDTGRSWYSNPPAAAQDAIAKGKSKQELLSNLVVSYANPEEKKMDTIPSRTGSANKKGVSVEKTAKGFVATYDFPDDGFAIPLRVELEKGSLRVSVDFSGIREYADNRIYTIRVLPYFGAVREKEEEGYAFVPEGSGALLRFGNGKTGLEEYSERVYGQDLNIQVQQQQERKQTIRLPVFGIKAGNDAFAGLIERGDAVASIEASVSGKTSGYNRVAAGFQVRPTDLYRFGSTASSLSQSTVVFADGPIGEQAISLRYVFLSGENASYAGMAGAYRAYLLETGALGARADGALPFYAEVLGGVVKDTTFLGFPTRSVEPMTTFDQAASLLEDLERRGVGNVVMKYNNWSRDMLWQRPSASAKAESRLGGNSGLKRLIAAAGEKGARIFPDTDYTSAARFGAFDGAFASAARTISDTNATTGVFRVDTFYRDTRLPTQYLLSLDKIRSASQKFGRDYARRFDNPCLSLGQMGNRLYSDYRNEGNTRQTSADLLEQVAGTFREAGAELLASGVNAYLIGAAAHLLDLPQTSRYDMFDEAVPFYQIAVHGYRYYAAEPWNQSEDMEETFLRAVETGAAPHYYWYGGDASALTGTAYAGRYGGDASFWMEEAAAQYARLSALHEKVKGCAVTGHEQPAPGVTITRYENGVTVAVNYTDKAMETVCGTVDARDYRIAERGAAE